jgi:hypothetical protein
MSNTINSDYSERYRELHVAHLQLMQDRYRDHRLDSTRQALASEHISRIERARELNMDLGQRIDIYV